MSTLITNTFTGKTTAGSISVTGEGGSTTTNLQQGLCKHWVSFDPLNSNNMDDSLIMVLLQMVEQEFLHLRILTIWQMQIMHL